jgi:hypothetical protein
MTGVKFKKTGKEVKSAIGQRIAGLQQRLSKRDRELDGVMKDKALLRLYLVREPQNMPRRTRKAQEGNAAVALHGRTELGTVNLERVKAAFPHRV